MDGRTKGHPVDTLLRASVLVPIRKGGPNRSKKPRPVAIGEAIRRLADGYAVKFATPTRFEQLKRIQLGVGEPGGLERAFHSVVAAMELARARGQQHVAIKVDVKNAFNACSRATILSNFFANKECSRAWRLLDWHYSTPSLLLCYEGCKLKVALRSQQGVQQGSSLSSLAFALAIQQCYEDCLKAAPEGSVTAVAYHDDLTLVGEPQHVLACFERFVKTAKELCDLEVNLGKTELFYPYAEGVAPEGIEDRCRQLGITFKRGHTDLLGAPIGFDSNHKASWLLEKVGTMRARIKKIQQIKSHLAYRLLSNCGEHLFGYLARVCAPAELSAAQDCAADKFDQAVHESLRGIAQLEPLDSVHPANDRLAFNGNPALQAALPIRMGGLGLRRYFRCVALAAHVASVCGAMRDIRPLIKQHYDVRGLPVDDPQRQRLPDIGMFNGMMDCVRQLRAFRCIDSAKLSGIIPADDAVFLQWFAPQEGDIAYNAKKMQSDITKLLDQALLKQLLRRGGDHDEDQNAAARIRSASDSAGNAWLTANPSPEHTLSNSAFRSAILLRLGERPARVMPEQCSCGTAHNNEAWHFHTCPSAASKARTIRHDRVVNALFNFASANGVHVYREEHHARIRDARADSVRDHAFRADLMFHHLDESSIVDVVITHPVSQTGIRAHAAEVDLAAASAAEQRKQSARRLDWAEQLQASFYPFGVEVFGAMGPSAAFIVRRLAVVAADRNGLPLSLMRRKLQMAISVAVQAGNARVIDDAVAAARQHRCRLVFGSAAPQL